MLFVSKIICKIQDFFEDRADIREAKKRLNDSEATIPAEEVYKSLGIS